MKKNKLNFDSNQVSKISLIISIIALIIAFYIEFFVVEPFIVFKAPVLLDSPPLFTVPHLIRTFCLALSSFFFLLSFHPFSLSYSATNMEKIEPVESNFHQEIQSVQSLSFAQKIVIYIILALSTMFVLIFLQNPRLFYILAREDYIIEYGSSLFCLIASLFCLISLIKLRKLQKQNKLLYLLGLGGLTLLFFVIGMEEISWGQRIFLFKTPEFFTEYGNQNEVNLHNFANNISEDIYYLLGFCLLILFPFIKNNLNSQQLNFLKKYPSLDLPSILSFFTPSLFVIYGSAILAAYNYDMWNNFLIQLSFFLTLFILIFNAIKHSIKTSFLPWIIILIFIVTQVIFLAFGHNFVREWDVTEYKEFFIPLGFTLYGFELLQKTKVLKS